MSSRIFIIVGLLTVGAFLFSVGCGDGSSNDSGPTNNTGSTGGNDRSADSTPVRQAAIQSLTQQGTLDLGNGVKMQFVRIEAGDFLMGSPANEAGRGSDETQHRVTISKPFYMGVYEVTQGQYQAVTGRNPSRFKGDDLPVEQVSWHDAVAFCKTLSERTGLDVRLPTEAEWEYACRAGTTTAYHTGNTISKTDANYSGSRTIPVGSLKKPNPWSLHDMHGNVWEWCADWHGDYPNGAATDPTGPANGTSRVLRGGSWYYVPGGLRAAYRGRTAPDDRGNYFGFRVCVSVASPGLP